MAVQQNKKSPSKRGMHRSHNALRVPGIAVEPTTGETHLRHHISPNGFYRGRQVLKNKSEAWSRIPRPRPEATFAVASGLCFDGCAFFSRTHCCARRNHARRGLHGG